MATKGLQIRQHALNQCLVGIVDQLRTTQMTLTLGGLLGQDVATERLLVLEAVGRLLEALGSAAVALDLRHGRTLHYEVFSENSGPAAGIDTHRPLDWPSDHFFLGATIMIIWRPSIFGKDSTVPISSRSAAIRSISLRPRSWCAISRPRKRSVTLPLSPPSRKRIRFFILT